MKLRIPNCFGGWGFLSFVAHLSCRPTFVTMVAEKQKRRRNKWTQALKQWVAPIGRRVTTYCPMWNYRKVCRSAYGVSDGTSTWWNIAIHSIRPCFSVVSWLPTWKRSTGWQVKCMTVWWSNWRNGIALQRNWRRYTKWSGCGRWMPSAVRQKIWLWGSWSMNETTQKNRCPFFSGVSIGFYRSTPVSQQTAPARRIHGCGGWTAGQTTESKEMPTWVILQNGWKLT